MRFTVLALAALTACTQIPPDPPTGESLACGASPDSNLVGQSVDILAAMTFPAPMRVIKPGMAITMDYNPKRLNIDVDDKGIITRVWCG